MPEIHDLFANNRAWAARMQAERPGFFSKLMHQQRPKFMWIGCSDSRVPANQITGLEPGEVFVHRNVANVVVHSDLNSLSAVQYAVDVLKVEHILVVGHYGCGGILAALKGTRVGLADNWIRHVKDVRDRHKALLDALAPEARADALVELNVIEQVINVSFGSVVTDAWNKGQKLTVHGWAYGVHDGLLQDLRMTVSSPEEIEALYSCAVKAAGSRRGHSSAAAEREQSPDTRRGSTKSDASIEISQSARLAGCGYSARSASSAALNQEQKQCLIARRAG